MRSISITGPDGAPSVQDVGDERQGLLDFVLPAGATGPTGATGATGATGPAGPAGPAGKGTAAMAYQLGSLRNEAADGSLTPVSYTHLFASW